MNTLLLVSIAIIIVLILICFILIMINSSKINTLLDYSDDGDIIGALKEYYQKVDDLAATIESKTDAVTLSRLSECESKTSMSVKKLGVIHFDAYDDVKGNLSFSVAMLNDNDDGIILTSLYGHNSCNTYVRDVRNGKTSVKLLKEEIMAFEKAKNKIRKGVENDEEK